MALTGPQTADAETRQSRHNQQASLNFKTMPVSPTKKLHGADAEYARKHLEIYREFTSSFTPMCKIPWIPSTAPESTILFEDTTFYKSMRNESKVALSLQMRLVDEVAQFYNPRRYYNMDCLALHQLSSKSQVWINFKQELLLQRCRGIRLFDVFGRICSYDPYDSSFDHHAEYAETLSHICRTLREHKEFLFDGITQVETCESAYEFLFEPWVLIHLPFKPVLMHQWLVGALAETLQFEKDVSEFFHLAIPSSLLKAAKRVASVLKKLHDYICKAFDHLNDCTTSPNVEKRTIIGVLEKLLPPLQFVCSAEGKEMIKALRRKILVGITDEKLVDLKKNSGHPRNFIYSLEFWLGNQIQCGLFGEQQKKGQSKSDNEFKPAWMLCSPDEVSQQEFLEYVISWAQENPITEQTKNHLLINYQFDQKLRLIVMKYKFYSKVKLENATGLGVISNILTLQAEVEATDAMYEVIRMLQCSVNLRPDKEKLNGPDFHLDEIHRALARAKGSKTGKDWFPTLSEELADKVKGELLKVEDLELVITLDLNDIALSLEARIKHVVLRIASRCYRESMRQQGEVFWLEDSNLAHYLLPCLVVALLEVLQDPETEEENKKWCLRFVDKLVKTFEMHELEVSTNSTYFNYVQFLSISEVGDNTVFAKQSERILATIPAELICKGGALQQFGLCLESFCNLSSCGCLMETDNYRFCTRLQYVLDSLSPEIAAVDAENIMIICRVIAGYSYANYEDNSEKTPNLATLAAAIFAICCKFNDVSFHRIKKLKPKAMVDLVSEFKKETANLSQQQLLGILMHMFVNYNHRKSQIETDCWNPSPFDPVYAVFHSYLVGDRWRLSQHLGHRMERVQHQVALQQAPVCYSLAIHEVSRKGKLKMGSPGEITFSPLQHCRWCGKVDVADFVVCKMCLEDQSYKDANLFCSAECETEALRVQHAEEHARHLMVLCGIQM